MAALAVPLAAGTTAAPVPHETCGELRSGGLLPGLDFPRDHDFAFEACTGSIRPGAMMSSPGCTYSFVLEDAAGALYIGTAGHCVSRVGQRVATPGVGTFGTVLTRWALNVDYALIKIDDDKRAFVNPTLCAWGGPVGADPGDRPRFDVLLEYGWGFATSATPQTRTRVLLEAQNTGNEIAWIGVGSGGDSGGPIVSVEGYAVGSHTRGITPLAGVAFEAGPTFARMLASGRTAVPSLELVTGDPTNVELIAQELRALA